MLSMAHGLMRRTVAPPDGLLNTTTVTLFTFNKTARQVISSVEETGDGNLRLIGSHFLNIS